MSYTELYKFKRSGKAQEFAEVRNSHRGAAAIWNILDKRYLPRHIPEWAIRYEQMGGDKVQEFYSRIVGEMQPIWDLQKDPNVSEVDRIVLLSTFDNVIVNRKDIKKLLEALRVFEGETSLKEQADLIEEELKTDKTFIAIAWNQTSINSDTWQVFDDRNDDVTRWYNIKRGTNHWSLFG